MLTLIKKYAFHIFVLIVFLLVSVYKFFPNTLNFRKPNSTQSAVLGDSSISTFIYVDLSGAVSKPGVYKLPKSSRIGDLIKEGGGFTKNASALWVSRNINLAKQLNDSQKVYVPFEWETYGDCTCAINSLYIDTPLIQEYSSNTSEDNNSSSSNTSHNENQQSDPIDNAEEGTLSDKVNVNTASQDDLDKLSGIGPAYALRIISKRPYKDFSDLTNKSGVPKSTLDKISGSLIY